MLRYYFKAQRFASNCIAKSRYNYFLYFGKNRLVSKLPKYYEKHIDTDQ